MIRHGGDLNRAISLYGGAPSDWLDLSTGISPWSYPTPKISPTTWRDLPPPLTKLIQSATEYYQCANNDIIATPGSQLAIRLIPQFFKTPQRVALPNIGYKEHAYSWREAGHELINYNDASELATLLGENQIDHCIVINPNNPTAEYIANEEITAMSQKLSGLMIVDEAFADLANEAPLKAPLNDEMDNNIVRLKSLGKFFGLAGARIGFVISKHPILEKLRYLLEPWSLSAPSIELARLALNDSQWQQEQRARIDYHAKRQRELMTKLTTQLDHARQVDQGLFFSIFAKHESINQLHIVLAQQKIWSRLGDKYTSKYGRIENWLRLSLAGDRLTDLANALDIKRAI